MKNKSAATWCAAPLLLFLGACSVPKLATKKDGATLPEQFHQNSDTSNVGNRQWQSFFNDANLTALIDTAFQNNQELNKILQEIQIARSEVKSRRGEYLPTVGIGVGAGAEKRSEHTLLGKLERTNNIKDDKKNPDPLPDFLGALNFSWEIDIWRKLHNAKDAAYDRYLASQEAKDFVKTQLVAEIASSYYELIALDQELDIVNNTIALQTNALEVAKVQKQATRVTELAVKKFEAEVLNTKSLQFDILQHITETENKLNFLLGRYPQPIVRSSFSNLPILQNDMTIGLPAQLLENRPDVKKAELLLQAAKLDVKVAKANFYPSLNLSSGIGLQAFNPAFIIKAPESLVFNIAGELVAPLVNKNAIKAAYLSANAQQLQSAFGYEQTLLNAYVEVVNQMSNIKNVQQEKLLKEQQVAVLQSSLTIANDLFNATRADYMEVLMTQRDYLESKVALLNTQKHQLLAYVSLYKSLGGGWKQ